jgi:hypothetical protein
LPYQRSCGIVTFFSFSFLTIIRDRLQAGWAKKEGWGTR